MVRMKAALRHSTAAVSRLVNRPKLDVVVAYEDYATGIDTVRTLTRLAERTCHSHEFGTHNVWNFQILATPAQRNIAAGKAASADMVIVAAHGSRRLPIFVMHWIELWLSQRGRSSAALVALLDGDNGHTRKLLPVEAYLERCARRGGMEFFVQKIGERLAVGDYNFAAMAEKAEQGSEALVRIMERPRGYPAEAFAHIQPAPRWGINE